VVAGVALVLGVIVGAGSGGPNAAHPSAAHLSGFFTRLHVLAGNGAGSFAAAQSGAENAAITRTLSYTPFVRAAGSQHREIALTFDDGPGPYTPQILSILERENAPGTFFEVGVSDTYFHASTSLIAARGYPIGDHTENHFGMGKLTPKDQRAQLLEEIATLKRYGVAFPHLFRPPYGSWNHATLKLLHKYHMLMVMWTVDTDDYERPGTKAIVHAAVTGARPGAIILLHDAGGNRTQTVQALPKIIKSLHSRGYKLVTVPRLLLDNPPPKDQDISAVIGAGG
jgi:peptidoglycan/xylan/chitin deacetylase (PgdA/CDA1 family)